MSSAVAAHEAPGDAGESSPLLLKTADQLRHMILDASVPGAFLGSEKDLMAILGVSRPTFRQAAKLLMHENLLTIKRGVHGGFFSQAPSGEAVSRTAALYLNMRNTTMRQINDVATPLQIEAALLLAQHPDPKHRARLREFVRHFNDPAVTEAERHPFRRMLAYETLLGDLAGNPAIALALKVMRDMLRDPRHGHFKLNDERATAYEQFQRRLADAVADGDAEMATLIAQNHAAAVNRWLDEAAAEE
jgi:GntR family transcriptional regulator, transcriptional repressor for pyruvate dehydrogenase complex